MKPVKSQNCFAEKFQIFKFPVLYPSVKRPGKKWALDWGGGVRGLVPGGVRPKKSTGCWFLPKPLASAVPKGSGAVFVWTRWVG